jgi:hypothetical protein
MLNQTTPYQKQQHAVSTTRTPQEHQQTESPKQL